jgi:hypothetical protein
LSVCTGAVEVQFEEELCWEFEEEDQNHWGFWELCQVGIEQCKGAQRKTELLSVLWRRYSARRASRKCADRHRGEENSLSSGIWRKSPLKDLHWVTEHPEGLSKRLLEQKDSQEGIHFILHLREKKDKIPKGSECLQKLRRDSTAVCMRRLCRSAESKNPLRIQRRRSSGRAAFYTHSEAQGWGARREKEAKVEAFERLKFSQVRKKVQEAQEEQRQPSDRQENRSGPLDFTSRRSSGGAYRRRRPTAVGSHIEIPSAVGSGEVVRS